MPNPTIVTASLSDEELKKSIDTMVKNLNDGLEKMKKSTDSAVEYMQKSLQRLGNTKIDTGGSSDGGSSKRAKAQNEETAAVEKTVAARDKEIKKNKEVEASFEQTASAMQKATKKKGVEYMAMPSDVDKSLTYLVNVNKDVDAQMDAILKKEQELIEKKQKEAQVSREIREAQQNASVGVSGVNLGWGTVHDMQKNRGTALSQAKEIDYLRQQIAAILDVKESDIRTTKVQSSTYNQLADYLKQLQTAYKSLSADNLKREGSDIAAEIQKVQRAMQQWQTQMSRPVSLSAAMGLSEKTLDDMSYKLRQLQSYRLGINLGSPTAASEINQVDAAIKRLKADMDKYMGSANQATQINAALARSWNYMKNRLAFYFTVGASTQFVKNLIEIRSQYEMNERALGILINSAEHGTRIFNELSQMALVSPYTLIELSAAAKQLTAYDIAARDVVDTTRRLADMASAVGVPIERLTYALGQIKAYGYLNSRDNRMFANAGIPLVKQLADYYTELEGRLVSTADVYDRIKKKAVDYNDVMQVINKMTDEGGKFFDFQAKMADTMKVQLANLTLAWNNMLNDIGKDTQGILVGGIGALKEIFLHWKELERVVNEIVVAFGAYKAAQLLITHTMGTTAASIRAQILAEKAHNAALLQKRALITPLTDAQKKLIATQRTLTASDYEQILSSKNLTKQKALLLVAFNKNNVALKEAIVNMGLLTTEETKSITLGKALGVVFKSLGISIKSVAASIGMFFVSNWWMFAIAGAYELWHAYDSAKEHIKELNTEAAEHAKQTFDNLKQYLESDAIIDTENKAIRKALSGADAEKAWQQQKDKIDETSIAANAFIATLEKEPDINKRIAKSFDYLKDVERVTGVMETMAKDAIEISSTTLGGIGGEGLADDLKDYIEAYEEYQEALAKGGSKQHIEGYFNQEQRELYELRTEIEKTTNSIYDFASKEGFNINEQREFFERMISETAQKEQMGQKETRLFRMKSEEEYYAYAKGKLVELFNHQDGKYKEATQKRIEELDKEFGTNKSLQESFFAWLSEKHANEVQKRLQNKTKQEIEQGNWLTKENLLWIEKMTKDFSREYGTSFDNLHNLVKQANTWSVNIPVFFRTIGQPISDVAKDYEERTGKKFAENNVIKDATTQVDIIKRLQDEQEKLQKKIDTAKTAGRKYYEDNKEAWEEENKALISDIHAYGALTKAEEKRRSGSKKDVLAEALQKEIQLVKTLQSDYDKLTKAGATSSEALAAVRKNYGNTIKNLNSILGAAGLKGFDINLIEGKRPHEVLGYFEKLKEDLTSNGLENLKRMELVEGVINTLRIDVKNYDMEKITKGLNNELGKLKDEYELAIAIDADPELGNAFADMMGINIESLPHTVKEYADRYSTYLNKYLKGKNSSLQFTGDELRGLTRDDITAFRGQVDAGTFNQEWFDAILKAYEDISGKRKKDLEDTEKWKNSLIEKYGNLQDKLTKIYKDSVQNQVNAVKTFGTEDQKSEIVRLQLRLEETDNPAELSEINTEIAKIVKDVTDKNPIALKLVTASGNQTKADASKAYWEDFKNSELYTMTFEDMANNSTRAIQLIMDKLDGLKDKVKEDPASMKALMKSLEDAEKELNTRDPFGGIARSLRDMATASQETETAQKALWRAEVDVEQAQQEVDNAEDGTPEEQAAAQQKLADAVQRRSVAQVKLTQAENKGKKAQENLKSSLQGITSELGNVKSLFDTVSSLFRAGGDDETADAIDAISEGFGVMTTVIMGVVAAMILLETSQPWLLAIAAALSVIVGLVKFLSGNENEKITKQVKESELAVKKLETSYVNLSKAIDDAIGTDVIGAKRAAAANKELQLVELKRQLQLEKSRDAKDTDNDKIESLKKQIVELQNELKNVAADIVNELMGVSSVGDAIESMMSSFVEALRSGDDAMKGFEESINDMIANMLVKMLSTKVLAPMLENVWTDMEKSINERATKEIESYRKASEAKTEIEANDFDAWNTLKNMSNKEREEWIKRYEEATGNTANRNIGSNEWGRYAQGWVWRDDDFRNWYHDFVVNKTNEDYERAKKEMEKATTPTIDDIKSMATPLRAVSDEMQPWADSINEMVQDLGLMKKKSLSALQQGIQGITEDTAGAIEAYLNIVSQRIFEHGEILMQIRDTLTGMNLDAQLGTQAQMLLQLQNSYQMQVSIRNILNSALNPSGSAFMVELNS